VSVVLSSSVLSESWWFTRVCTWVVDWLRATTPRGECHCSIVCSGLEQLVSRSVGGPGCITRTFSNRGFRNSNSGVANYACKLPSVPATNRRMPEQEFARAVFLPIIIGTPRQGRLTEPAANSVFGEVSKRSYITTEMIDIRKMP